MSTIEREIRERVDAFVNDLSELVRHAALEAVTDALHGQGVPGARASRRAANGRSGRRSPAELKAQADKLFSEIRAKPGQRIEQIAKALDTPTKDLALPVTKLLDEGKIRRQGQKRATRYFPSRGGRGGKKRAKS